MTPRLLIPFLTTSATRTPVAIYTTFAQRVDRGLPRCAMQRIIRSATIRRSSPPSGPPRRSVRPALHRPDLSRNRSSERQNAATSGCQSFEERHPEHSRLLKAAAAAPAPRNPTSCGTICTRSITGRSNVAEFVAERARDLAPGSTGLHADMLAADGTAAREAAMAAAIAEPRAKSSWSPAGSIPSRCRRPIPVNLHRSKSSGRRPGGAHALWLRAARPAQRLRKRHAVARVLSAALGRP